MYLLDLDSIQRKHASDRTQKQITEEIKAILDTDSNMCKYGKIVLLCAEACQNNGYLLQQLIINYEL